MEDKRTNINALEIATDEFFNMHWNKDVINENPPKWKKWEKENDVFMGSIPYLKFGGCYALVDSADEVIYIGVGLSSGNKYYTERGVSKRLIGHVIRSYKRIGWVTKEKWKGVSEIYTIGFPKDLKHISLSLEDYLIWKLSPKENKNQVRHTG